MRFSLVKDVKNPSRGTSQAAGVDFYVPKFSDKFINDFNSKNVGNDCFLAINSENKNIIKIAPFNTVAIPTGVHIYLDNPETMFELRSKSGISLKKQLATNGGIVDSDYQGEIVALLYNTTDKEQFLTEDEKFVQGIVTKISLEDVEQDSFENLYNEVSERGDKGFGTGSKN